MKVEDLPPGEAKLLLQEIVNELYDTEHDGDAESDAVYNVRNLIAKFEPSP